MLARFTSEHHGLVVLMANICSAWLEDSLATFYLLKGMDIMDA
jgi:hypothetical protein